MSSPHTPRRVGAFRSFASPRNSRASRSNDRHHPYTPKNRRTSSSAGASSSVSSLNYHLSRATLSSQSSPRTPTSRHGPAQSSPVSNRQRRRAEAAALRAEFISKTPPMPNSELAKFEKYFNISESSANEEEEEEQEDAEEEEGNTTPTETTTPEKRYRIANFRVAGGQVTEETLFRAVRHVSSIFSSSELSIEAVSNMFSVGSPASLGSRRNYNVMTLSVRNGCITGETASEATKQLRELCLGSQVRCRTEEL
ncbi:hypothetical protein C8034_v005257 [Colletotrichum sidae]|uniref:Uncharacterized protein n=1 Tax=Colletotrichum sidae TaxID=1347389 RepID=A0A4R8T6T8_9PEZI|nr:hypothetical protein C8034_v005257 [Colletotrichum sidae]